MLQALHLLPPPLPLSPPPAAYVPLPFTGIQSLHPSIPKSLDPSNDKRIDSGLSPVIDTQNPLALNEEDTRETSFLSRIVSLYRTSHLERCWQPTLLKIRSGGRGMEPIFLIKKKKEKREKGAARSFGFVSRGTVGMTKQR